MKLSRSTSILLLALTFNQPTVIAFSSFCLPNHGYIKSSSTSRTAVRTPTGMPPLNGDDDENNGIPLNGNNGDRNGHDINGYASSNGEGAVNGLNGDGNHNGVNGGAVNGVNGAGDVNGASNGEVAPPTKLVDKDLNDIFAQNRHWKATKEMEDADFFKKLGAGHNPKYMWIGCADARVPANEIMGQAAGSVFVVRNVANMVVSTDFNVMAALQYAVDVLKVDHLIVCGHYDCGGVRASLQNLDHVPPLENWLRNIRDVYRLHREELDAIDDDEARHRRLVELNVVEQCMNLFKTGVVQRRRIETFKSGQEYTTPRIHACVFDPKVGLLQKLEVDFREYIDELHGIYDLYTVDENEKIRLRQKHQQNQQQQQ